MKTLSLKLPDSLDAKLTMIARQRRKSKSALVRDALELFFAGGDGRRMGSFLAMAKDLAGCVEGPTDLSFNKNHMRGYGQ
jgi:hypothetical protein